MLELTADGLGLVVRAGTGLPDGVLGGVISTQPDQLPGYALQHPGTVIVDDFRTETRFEPSPIQRDLGIVSALVAQIRASGRQFGGIGAHSRTPQHFSPDDAHFLQAVANVIGAAVERARHEEAVRDSEAQFRELADTAPVLMWMTDSEGHVAFVNEGWLRFTGLDPRRGPGRHLRPQRAPGRPRRAAGALARLVRSAGRVPLRVPPALRRHGEYRWVLEVGVPRYAGGEFAGYVGTATDIHERKQMEDALRSSEAGFRDLADSAPVMIWTTDESGSVTFVNEGWLAYTGNTLEEELGVSWSLGVHPDEAPRWSVAW